MEPAEHVRRICNALVQEQEQRSQGLVVLEGLVKSGEFRDWPFTNEFYAALFSLIPVAFSWEGPEGKVDVERAERLFLALARAPEFDSAEAEAQVTTEFLWSIASRADGTTPQDEWPFLRDVLLWLYERFVRKRAQLRILVGRKLRSFGQFSHKGAPIAPLLQVLGPIIRGFEVPLAQAHKSLLFEILLPLHRPNDWLVWDRQTPLISMYHKELVHCIVLFLTKQPELSVRCVEMLCTHFPSCRESNTPKEVLLLHEIAAVLKFVDPAGFQQLLPLLVRQMTRLLGSHNAQPIESVLQFWKDARLAELFRGAAAGLIPPLLPVLLRGGEPFWNPTVNKMTALVLEKLEQSDPALFAQVAENIWGPGRQQPAFEAPPPEPTAADRAESDARMAPPRPGEGAGDVRSLKFGMQGWKPPGAGGGIPRQPPVTVTGVAPWAFQGSVGGMAQRQGPLSQLQHGAAPKQPPSTITGVAPWAFDSNSRGKAASGPLTAMAAPGGAQSSQPARAPLGAVGEGGARTPGAAAQTSLGAIGEDAEDNVLVEEKSGLDRVHKYMKLLSPAGSADVDAPWEAALMSETPTLLPALKFHQLVFGHQDLGVGAFSVVRYARVVQKDKTQSQWAEYAVKVINTKTMQDLGYEASVNREICVLRMLSHPGIARLVSSFRWRDGAYLVLEYASKGDLHSILMQRGKIEEDIARFFIGETIAALNAIHQIGFVYADLKPENIVITATGHAKLADFGGCRPLTEEARRRTQESLIRGLRNGDWRAADAGEGEAQPAVEEAAPGMEVEDDGRVEGTTMYLPPEVVRGGAPTLAADAWALGCLAYQLLSGRPPIWAETDREEDLHSRIVSFKLDDSLLGVEELSERARGLTAALLEADAERRLSVEQAALHIFFDGVDVFVLHRRPRGPELPKAERAAPVEDARWQKRQFSKIWTAMPAPQDYAPPEAFGDGRAATVEIRETEVEREAPFGEEVMAPPTAPTRKRVEEL